MQAKHDDVDDNNNSNNSNNNDKHLYLTSSLYLDLYMRGNGRNKRKCLGSGGGGTNL